VGPFISRPLPLFEGDVSPGSSVFPGRLPAGKLPTATLTISVFNTLQKRHLEVATFLLGGMPLKVPLSRNQKDEPSKNSLASDSLVFFTFVLS